MTATVPVLKARLMPRDAFDACVAMLVGGTQVIVLLVIPSGAVGLITRSLLSGVLAFLCLYFLWLSFTVWQLKCDADGLQFVRLLGTPRHVAWREIVSVEEAPRAEVIVRGWLWPPFPAREMTTSLTSLGYYRIRMAAGDTYFPPSNPEEFLERIRAGRAGLGEPPIEGP